MTQQPGAIPDPGGPRIRCALDDRDMEPRAVTVGYLGSAFQVELLQCPVCAQVYIPPALAMGKMVEVEQQLEDK
jgi:hypothetical protein